jgi:hypothetical protein
VAGVIDRTGKHNLAAREVGHPTLAAHWAAENLDLAVVRNRRDIAAMGIAAMGIAAVGTAAVGIAVVGIAVVGTAAAGIAAADTSVSSRPEAAAVPEVEVAVEAAVAVVQEEEAAAVAAAAVAPEAAAAVRRAAVRTVPWERPRDSEPVRPPQRAMWP